jgi:DNA-binding NarL/FixJ family response regulator
VEEVKTPIMIAAAAHDGASNPADAWGLLTDAEWRLVLLASSGWNDRRIASATGTKQVQVKRHFRALLDKLGFADRLTLILASFADGSSLGRRLRGAKQLKAN